MKRIGIWESLNLHESDAIYKGYILASSCAVERHVSNTKKLYSGSAKPTGSKMTICQ